MNSVQAQGLCREMQGQRSTLQAWSVHVFFFCLKILGYVLHTKTNKQKANRALPSFNCTNQVAEISEPGRQHTIHHFPGRLTAEAVLIVRIF